jgi:hypothetical protein
MLPLFLNYAPEAVGKDKMIITAQLASAGSFSVKKIGFEPLLNKECTIVYR